MGTFSRLPREFYERPTLVVAADLLGKVLVHDHRGMRTAGAIVEVEAYIGESDPACHAAPGPTQRNAPLYGHPGFAYVYLNYGIHCLFNVVTEAHGSPAAVLVRALDPLDGVEEMRRRRLRPGKGRQRIPPRIADRDLGRGPGNLTVAMAIALSDNRADLVNGGGLFLEDRGIVPGAVSWGPRIGIRLGTERPWRAWMAGHPAVSGRHAAPAVRSSTSPGPASRTRSKSRAS